MSALELQVADRFPVGTKVQVHPRVHDFFTPGQTESVKTATVTKDGTVKLSGLIEHGPYFLAAEVPVHRPTPRGLEESNEWRSVAFVASDPAPALTRDDTNDLAAREGQARAEVVRKSSINLASAPGAASPRAENPVIVGARDTSVLPERIEGTKSGTPLASHTVTGEAVVVGEEPPGQEDVGKRTPQSSDTEVGSAALIEERRSQEEVSGRTKQASDTETGQATAVREQLPKPKTEATTRKTAARKARSALQPSPRKAGAKKGARKSAKKTGTRKAAKRSGAKKRSGR